MSDLTAPVVGFAQDYNNLGDTADVDVSIDGGETWETVLHQTTDVRGPRTDVLQLPTAAGQSEVQVRFHYYDASYAWWWQVDDVFVGNRTCDPIEGGLVVGNVRGSTGRTGINGATVTSIDKPADKATTKPTPDDPARRRRLLPAVLVADREAPVRGQRQAVPGAAQDGERAAQPHRGGRLPARGRAPDASRRRAWPRRPSSAAPRSRRRSRSPTTAPLR